MRIALDARLLYYRQAGIGSYTVRLLEALTREAPQERFLVLHDRRGARPPIQAPNLTPVPIFTPSHHRFESLTLPVELLALRPEVLHSPDFVLPARRSYAGVVTVHDLAFLRFPQWVTAEAGRYYGRVRQAVRSAEKVIAVSECTRRDVLELLEVAPDKVTVIHEAAGGPFVPLDPPPTQPRTFKGRTLAVRRFALFVGTIEPRKNLPTLLQALRRMLDRFPDLEPHPRLIVAGAQGWLSESLFGQVHDLRLSQEVAFIGPVSQEELVWLYNAARFLVFPSLYEGFGLPPLEAMSCGTPVIASSAGAVPEVVGTAGLLVDPQDVDGWAEAMAKLWADEALRDDLRDRGRERAALFSWERAARETLAVYREALALRRKA